MFAVTKPVASITACLPAMGVAASLKDLFVGINPTEINKIAKRVIALHVFKRFDLLTEIWTTFARKTTPVLSMLPEETSVKLVDSGNV